MHDWVFFPSKPRSGCLHLDCKGPNHSGLVPVRRHRSDARCVLFIQVEVLFLFMALCQGIRLESSRFNNSMTWLAVHPTVLEWAANAALLLHHLAIA